MPEEGYFSNYEKMSPQQIEVGLRKMGLKDPLYVQVGKLYTMRFAATLAYPTATVSMRK